jgi:hypothetical protein
MLALIAVVGGAVSSCGGDEAAPAGTAQIREQVAAEIRQGEKQLRRAGIDVCHRHPKSLRGREASISLLLDRYRVSLGGRLFARIQNGGPQDLGYGQTPLVDQFAEGGWHPRPLRRDGHPVVFGAILLRLKPHTISSCLEIPVSEQWPAGLYRVRFEVEALTDAKNPDLPVAYFRVT